LCSSPIRTLLSSISTERQCSHSEQSVTLMDPIYIASFHFESYSLNMDHHVIALLALIGMGLDLLGGLFLAYDLFGRRRGPLRTLLRAILYCFIFVAVFSIALDWRFALVGGTGLGLTITYELGRTTSAVEGATGTQEPRGFFSLKRQQISLVLLRA